MLPSNDERVQIILQHFDLTLEDYFLVSTLAKKLNKSVSQVYLDIEKHNIPKEKIGRFYSIKGIFIVELLLKDFDYHFNKDYLSLTEIKQQYKDIFRTNDGQEIPKKIERICPKGIILNNNTGIKYHKNDIENFFKKKFGNLSLDFISELLNSGDYMNSAEMCRQIGCEKSFVQGKLPHLDKVYVTSVATYVHKDCLVPLIKAYEEYLRNKDITPTQLVEVKIKEHSLATTFPITTELFIQYALKVLNTSRKKHLKDLALVLINVYDYLINSITKEITELTDMEIILILSNENVPTLYIKKIPPFLKWVSHKVTEVKYKEIPKISIKINFNTISTYSANEFYKMYDYLINIDNHLEKAVNDFYYAQCWFIGCMNFTNAWRMTDIVDFPSPNLCVLNKEISLNWFINNQLTASDSQKIINEIIETNYLEINKTGAFNKLFVHQDMLIPFVTALCITELHRESLSESILLPSVMKKTYQKKMKTFFPNDFPKYSSKKITKTLLTNLEREARDIGNLGGISNVISSRLRGHKDLNSTAYYVGLDSVNEPVEASRHLFRRGHFGYLYSLLVDLINPHNEFTMEEKTAAIEVIKEYFTPLQVENNSQFFLLQLQRQNSISEMILSMDSLSIMESLNAIYHNNHPARIKEAQCLSETCINPQSDCLNCPLLVPKTFMLQELKEEIEDLLKELQTNTSTHSIKSQKLTYLILVRLNLINEASKTFGKEYINAFIDLKDLKAKISNVQNLLEIKEGS